MSKFDIEARVADLRKCGLSHSEAVAQALSEGVDQAIETRCPPEGENVGASSVTTPVSTGPRAGIPLSNLDCNNRLVKRGCVVSYHGLRFQVHKVSRGWFWGRPVGRFGVDSSKLPSRLMCETVQVVV